MRNQLLAAALVFITCLGGAAWAEPAPLSNPQPAAAFTRNPCPETLGKDVVCGVFTVPENRQVPGRILPLRVVILPAVHKTGKPPVFMLSGGPGQAATDPAEDLQTEWERQQHDVVLLDQRGTGEGNRLDCALPATASLERYMADVFSNGVDYAQCRRDLEKKADLTLYTTPVAMQDLDDLRKILGYDRIYLEGGSYGTHAARVYVRMFEPHVAGVYLSGLAAVEDRAPLNHAAAAQRAFDLIVSQCRAEPPCAKAFPDPAGDLRAVMETLREAPAPVTIKDPRDGKSVTVRLDVNGFASGLRRMLYSVEGARRIPLLLHRARGGDYRPFAQITADGGYGINKSLAIGLLLSVSCPEDLSRIRPQEVAVATKGTFLGDLRLRGQLEACAKWVSPKMPAWYYHSVPSRVPALLVAGNLDPVTPPKWTRYFEAAFPDHVSVLAQGAHVSDDDCISAMARQLFENGRTADVDRSCLARERLPAFALTAP